jgi:alcohol dehydrogenase class IV
MSGTGNEVTPDAVITDTHENYKMGACGWKLLPRAALIDPAMMASMPAAVTAATGMDTLSPKCDSVDIKGFTGKGEEL